ncbi:MAG TPA: DUF4838 domain-containing protein [Chitinophagaceae bacterium]|jgi:hypothetical protein|nr:DUF4838 domain-containing protein [Chitinophagaceae bacterium]
MIRLIFFLLFIVTFSVKGSAQTPVIVYTNSQAGDSIDVAVKLLTTELSKAGKFSFTSNNLPAFKNSQRGILLATTSQAAANKITSPASLSKMGPEAISIQASMQNVVIIANSALAVQESVYLYLEQLGYRWLMPGSDWNVVPGLNSPYKKISILTQPHYEHRWIANGHAYMNSKKIMNDFNGWAAANRLGGAMHISTGHSYDAIVASNKDEFLKHPEYYAIPPAKGTLATGEFKFNVTNKDLVNLVVKDAMARYEQQMRIDKSAHMVTMEPSDGGGYCQTCKNGTASDQAFYLANAVAKELRKKYPASMVGSLAYNDHILPPVMKFEPNVFIMITNGFNRSKYSTLELLQQWKTKVPKLGIYEYLSVYEWDNDLPGQMNAAKIDYLQKSIKDYYNNGVRAYLGESVMGWIARGPGQYLVSKLTWNINVNVDSVMTDFYSKAYENVAPVIRKLYDQWQYYPHRIPTDNDFAQWFGWVNEAYNAAKNDVVRKRIDYLKEYLHYLVLYRNLKQTPGEENLNKVLNFAYRTFEETAFSTLPTMLSLPVYSGYPALGWYNPNLKWKEDNRPVSKAELDALFRQSLNSFKKTEGLVKFNTSNDFIKVNGIAKAPAKYLTTAHAIWFPTEYIIRVNKQSADNAINIKSDYSAQPPFDRPVELRIYNIPAATSSAKEGSLVLSFDQSKKQVLEKFSLASLKPGLYKLKVDDQRKMFIMDIAGNIDYSIVAGAENKVNTTSAAGLNTFFFYVPAGTKKFEVMKGGVMVLKTPAGRIIDKQNRLEENFVVDVQAGEAGIWTIEKQAGTIYLEGVPPYLGHDPATMLIPSYLKK